MDRELERTLNEVIDKLKAWSIDDVETASMDPLSKMMLVALLYETQKIQDSIKDLTDKITDHFCENFIPRKNVSAMPSITILEPSFKKEKMEEGVVIDGTSRFVYKPSTAKKTLNYIPIFRNYALPVDGIYWLSAVSFHSPKTDRFISVSKGNENILWLGLSTSVEIECLKGLSILFKNTQGVSPIKISVGESKNELAFATMNQMENIEMVEPFDAQQSSNCMFSFLQSWKEALLDMQEVSLIYLTDPIKDRDLFKSKHNPSVFKFCLLSEELDAMPERILWLKVEFPKGYCVPADCSVSVNAFPVVNIDVDHVILTTSNPIAKLQKQEDVFFLNILNTSNLSSKDGFDIEEDEYFIRDFGASCYHDGDLYRDVRNLYHHFVEDYHAFLEYNGIKDGEIIRQLRESFNKIGKSVGAPNTKYKFDSGVYAMRNINCNPQPASTKVSFLTTQGNLGNQPQVGEIMENRKHPAFNKEVQVVVPACCGRDKMSADERYEQLRYYALTQDRLYTKMDIDAFLRKEIMSEFGSEEFKRIFVKISIGGTEGITSLRRGLYIDIEFKDKKNYDKAVATSFATRMQQRITNKSCLTMPVNVSLINLEK